MPRKTKEKGGNSAAVVEGQKGETEVETMARVFTSPAIRHGAATSGFIDKMMGKLPGEPKFDDYSRAITAKAKKTREGDLALASDMLMAQAITLDAMFTELARRCAMNLGEYINAAERFGRLALKAQSNSRATLEALAKLHQPREQTVRHVHVNEGGQAVIADSVDNRSIHMLETKAPTFADKCEVNLNPKDRHEACLENCTSAAGGDQH